MEFLLYVVNYLIRYVIWCTHCAKTRSELTGNTAAFILCQTPSSSIISSINALVAAVIGLLATCGSVKADNIAELMGKSDIDGALVGGAALDPVGFSKIVKF